MSRLRRIAQHSRFFFITCNLRREVRPFTDAEFALLSTTLVDVRRRTPFALCGYCFMPDHWHAIIFPNEGSSISDILMRVKVGCYQRIRKRRADPAAIWQSRFYDRILRTRREFDETLAYIHENPLRKGIVDDPLAWNWSGARWFADRSGPIEMNEVRLPLNPGDRI